MLNIIIIKRLFGVLSKNWTSDAQKINFKVYKCETMLNITLEKNEKINLPTGKTMWKSQQVWHVKRHEK